MPATTSPLAFPYPIGSDPVADGDNQIRLLAEKLDDYLAGSDAAVTPASGLTAAGAGCSVSRRGSVGFLSVSVNVTTPLSVGYTILTLPAGYRPGAQIAFMLSDGANANHMFQCNAAGAVFISLATISGGQLYGLVAFPMIPVPFA